MITMLFYFTSEFLGNKRTENNESHVMYDPGIWIEVTKSDTDDTVYTGFIKSQTITYGYSRSDFVLKTNPTSVKVFKSTYGQYVDSFETCVNGLYNGFTIDLLNLIRKHSTDQSIGPDPITIDYPNN